MKTIHDMKICCMIHFVNSEKKEINTEQKFDSSIHFHLDLLQ